MTSDHPAIRIPISFEFIAHGRLVTPAPSIPPIMTCVRETGIENAVRSTIMLAADSIAEKVFIKLKPTILSPTIPASFFPNRKIPSAEDPKSKSSRISNVRMLICPLDGKGLNQTEVICAEDERNKEYNNDERDPISPDNRNAGVFRCSNLLAISYMTKLNTAQANGTATHEARNPRQELPHLW